MSRIVRLAHDSDADSLLAIYAPIVRDTAISFELVPPDVDEFRDRIRNVLASHVWLVCQQDASICGYAYAGGFRSREAYRWTAEVTVYVAAAHQRTGVARALYRSLFAVLRLQGFNTAIAGIALPNPASVGLHEALGFQPIGVARSVGYKFGEWQDVGWWQLALGSESTAPTPPRPISILVETRAWHAALAAGLAPFGQA